LTNQVDSQNLVPPLQSDTVQYLPSEFSVYQKETKAFKYDLDSLRDIIYGNHDFKEQTLTRSESKTEKREQKVQKKIQTKYSTSLVKDSFIVKTSYLSARIFESLFESDHSFSDIIGPYKPKEHSLIENTPFQHLFYIRFPWI